MRCIVALFVVLFSISVYPPVFAQTARPGIAAEPAWINKRTIDYNKRSLDNKATDGYIDIAFETQVSLADQCKYVRSSKKIISQAGVQNGSEISVSFDPSYERLFFHSINIIRGSEKLNRLKPGDIKTVHQETELKNFIYNGTLDAVLVLEDVRRGDIIEYSYSIKGFNPIFKNKYTAVYSTAYTVPIYDVYYRLIVPGERKVNIKNLGETIQPATSSVNGQQVYEWQKRNVEPLLLQDYTPSWYDPYAQVQISEYNSWKEVNDWAMELFPLKKELSPAVQGKVKEIMSAYTDNGARTAEALRFVQDDIRYMGIEMGVNSHKPADPSKVFIQRFGDCKEKSYLLCCMLNAMHIEASPVLINTVSKKTLFDYLPAATDFDHVTVRVKLDDGYYWFDPTIAYQRGDIRKIYYPDYQAGLVIAPNTTALTPIGFKNISYQHVKEKMDIPDMTGEARLVVATAFFGTDADVVRNDFNNRSIAELMTDYQKFYAAFYEDIRADSLDFTDDEKTGVFTTKEYYTISNLWTKSEKDGDKFSFSAFIIDRVFRRPKEKKRTMPFWLMYPARYKEEVEITMPSEWNVTESEETLKNANFNYHYRFYCAGNKVYLDAEYENYKSYTSVDEAANYFADLGRYDDMSNFELSSGGSPDSVKKSSSKTSNKGLVSIFVVAGLVIGGLIWWSRRN